MLWSFYKFFERMWVYADDSICFRFEKLWQCFRKSICWFACLFRNGHGAYSIRDMEDEENFQKAEAMIRLMCELNAGICSAEEEGWIPEEDFHSHFKNKRNDR